MADIEDLDVLVPVAKQVRLGGQVYTLPADMPMEIFLRVNLAGRVKDADGEPDQMEQIKQLTSCLVDLFTYELPPDADADAAKQVVHDVLMARGVRYVFELLKNIYKMDEAESDEDPTEDQAQPVADSNGTTSSST